MNTKFGSPRFLLRCLLICSFQASWKYLAFQYGIDMFVTGHVHRQDCLEQWDWRNQFKPTASWPNKGEGPRLFASANFSSISTYSYIYIFRYIPTFSLSCSEKSSNTQSTRDTRERERNWVMWKIHKTFPFDSDLFWIVLPFLSRLSLCSMFKFDVLMCTSTHSLSQACLSCG